MQSREELSRRSILLAGSQTATAVAILAGAGAEALAAPDTRTALKDYDPIRTELVMELVVTCSSPEKSKTQLLVLPPLPGFGSDSGGTQFGAVMLPVMPVEAWLKLPGKVVPEFPLTPFSGMMPVRAKLRSSARIRFIVWVS